MPMSFGGISKQKVATVIVAIDGTGDTTDIQTGINMLPADGGVVYIKEGTYTITSSIIIDSSNVSIRGAGYSTEILTTSNVTMLSLNGGVGDGQITIDGLRLTGAGAGNGSNVGIFISSMNNVSIFNVIIKSCGSYGILTATPAQDHRYWKLRIEQCEDSGIKLVAPTNVVLDTVILFFNSGHGIEETNYQGNVYLVNSYVYFNSKNGVALDTVDNFKIENCSINNNLWHGISMNSCNENVIIGNTIFANDRDNAASYDGVYLTNTDHCIINSNWIGKNDRYQINVSDNTCNENIITGNQLNSSTGVGDLNNAGIGTVDANNINAAW